MKNIILKSKIRFINPIPSPQYRGGFRGLFVKKSSLLWLMAVLFLGILSCNEQKPNSNIAPKFEDTQKTQPIQETIQSFFTWENSIIAILIILLFVLLFVIIKNWLKDRALLSIEKDSATHAQQKISKSEKTTTQTVKRQEQPDELQKQKDELERQRLDKAKIEKERDDERNKRIESEREKVALKAEIERLNSKNKGEIMTELPEVEATKDDKNRTLNNETTITSNIDVMPTPEITYLSLPMNEMIFNNASRSPVPMIGQSFYEFFISKDGMTATFKFWNNPDAVKHAIDKPHSHIEPACEPINARDSYATRIVTEKDGYAVLEDNKWIVKTKAKIKYLT